ncbi:MULTISPECIES: DUF4097 family beta strand repeat-containing protein [Priestia]|uniref:DUF4097 family beta strand repeat-containing protein n=1 Tax=Priestia TaxID=2800373 RepID=UPI000BF8F841|nr:MULTISPECIES: DUF4097 family beta strand repeat-containing protein [Priestia]AVX09660.1 hypothetical protein CS527_18775 [Bacillus sp. Y-01]MBZ5481192.1 DUF4097 family beta strand repeat protein [Bacillus sp. T_4]MDH6653263.1 DUF4097 and DUF4098 domain-containing protein YvlB [Bacillus sp. PvP124]RFB26120.1 hypothetical protein DZB87_18595 [Bacillus sp. ALD]MCU7762813.1 DUF4097 domain-containing protein [Priestia megaterium]
MLNKKKLSILAGILILVGIIGSLLTYRAIDPEPISKEKVINSNQVSKVNIDTDNTRVHVYPIKGDNVKVTLKGETSPNIKRDFTTAVKNSTLFISYNEQQRSWVNFDIVSVLKPLSINVYLPEKQYNSLGISSNNGYVSVKKLRAADVSIGANNGRVELEDIDSQNLNTSVHNGLTSIKNAAAKTVQAKVNNGKITLSNVQGSLKGETHNGSIALETKELDRDIDFKTNNGKIKITTKKEPSNVQFNVSVDNGKVDILNKYDSSAVIGKGKNIIKLATHNGSISVIK